MAQKKTSNGNAKAIGIGVGVTAAMVAAAGAYFLYGSKNAAKNRKQVKSWMLKAKAEVLEGIETTKDLSKENYEMLVDTAIAGYGKLKSISKPELESLRRELKSHWKHLERRGKKAMPSAKTVAQKATTKGKKMARKKTVAKK